MRLTSFLEPVGAGKASDVTRSLSQLLASKLFPVSTTG